MNFIKKPLKYWRIVFVILFFQFLLSTTSGLQVYRIIDMSVGNSLSLGKLVNAYDYTVINDFLNHHGKSYVALLGHMRWIVLIYLIFGSFINTGLIYCISHSKFKVNDFFSGGSAFYFKLLGLDILFLILIGIVSALAFFLVFYLFGITPYVFDTELIFINLFTLTILVSLCLIHAIIAIKTLAKSYYFLEDKSLFQSVREAITAFFNRPFLYTFLGLFFLLITILTLFLNHAIGTWILLILIVFQVLILIFKGFLRVLYYQVIIYYGLKYKHKKKINRSELS